MPCKCKDLKAFKGPRTKDQILHARMILTRQGHCTIASTQSPLQPLITFSHQNATQGVAHAKGLLTMLTCEAAYGQKQKFLWFL